MQDYSEIIRDIEKGQLKPIYLLMGEEPYFIDVISERIENTLDPMVREFGLMIVYGRDTSMEQVVGSAKSFPMLGERQVVILREAQEMKEFKSRKDDDESELKYLLSYAENPSTHTTLVICLKNKTLDKRKKLFKTIDKKAVVFQSEKIKDYHLTAWIEKYVKERKLSIEKQAAVLLAEYLGNDIGKVVNAVDKLAIVLGDSAKITSSSIEENIGISKDYNVWELQRALGQKDALKCYRIIHYFESNPKANPIQMVIPSLYSFFIKLAIFGAATDKSKVAGEIGINSYFLKEYQLAAANYNVQKTERIIHWLR
ncbi:MAG: DNA polymerase III subunit delta [Flavobacteriales bacterium]